MIYFNTKNEDLFKAPNVEEYSFVQKNKHLLTLSFGLYTQFVVYIHHFRILLLTHFIFLSFVAFLFLNGTPLGTPFFSVDQSE